MLTPMELAVLRHLVDGKTNKEIARRIGVSPHTVRDHLQNIARKTACKNRVQMATWWSENRAALTALESGGIRTDGPSPGSAESVAAPPARTTKVNRPAPISDTDLRKISGGTVERRPLCSFG